MDLYHYKCVLELTAIRLLESRTVWLNNRLVAKYINVLFTVRHLPLA